MIKMSPFYKTERNHKIYEERKAGAKLQEIADKYGLSKDRVRQIYLKEERYEKIRKYGAREV